MFCKDLSHFLPGIEREALGLRGVQPTRPRPQTTGALLWLVFASVLWRRGLCRQFHSAVPVGPRVPGWLEAPLCSEALITGIQLPPSQHRQELSLPATPCPSTVPQSRREPASLCLLWLPVLSQPSALRARTPYSSPVQATRVTVSQFLPPQ